MTQMACSSLKIMLGLQTNFVKKRQGSSLITVLTFLLHLLLALLDIH